MVEADTDDGRDAHPDDGADQDGSCATVGGRCGCLTDEKERGLDAFPDDGDKGQRCERVGGAVVERAVDRRVELAANASRLATHPEQHPRDDTGREDQGRRLEQLLVRFREAADRHEERDPEDGAGGDRETRSEEDPRKQALVAGLGQVRADDRDDEGRFDPFAKASHQTAGKRSEIHGGRWSPLSQGDMIAECKVACHREFTHAAGFGQTPRRTDEDARSRDEAPAGRSDAGRRLEACPAHLSGADTGRLGR